MPTPNVRVVAPYAAAYASLIEHIANVYFPRTHLPRCAIRVLYQPHSATPTSTPLLLLCWQALKAAGVTEVILAINYQPEVNPKSQQLVCLPSLPSFCC